MEKIHNWHQTKTGLAVFALLELVGAYVFASWSINSGNLLDYLFTLLFLIGALQNFVKFVRGWATRAR
jgi:hypothetical protein